VTLATGLGHLDAVQRIDLASNVVIGAIIGWIGGELVERLRERTLGQEIELRRLNRELLVRATTDALTGLSNRRQLDTDLQMLSTPRLRAGPSCAFIMLDLDRFKRLNDELGHAVGDAALRSVSAELRRVVRGRDTIYRYGGEEFLVIMPNASLLAAREAAERIRGAIVDLHIKAGVASDAPSLTISCGVAFSLIAREQWETVLAAADSALYEAKATGRNRVCVMPDPVGEDAPTLSRDRRRSGGRTRPTPARTAGPIEPDVDGTVAVA
jgi:diguanylate cyclase (GGDEF)-like protein